MKLLLILLIIFLLCLKKKKEYMTSDIKYYNYRLSDIFNGYVYNLQMKKNDLKFNDYINKYKDTIAYKYVEKCKNLKQKWGNIKVLEEISRKKEREKTTLHLRIGDVLVGYDEKKNYFKKLESLPYKYFYQIDEYQEIIQILKKKKIKKIYLFYGNHKKHWNKANDIYIKKIKEKFKENNIELETDNLGNPDDDFIKMSNSEIFIQSGGGFSKIIASLVKLRGGMVLDPKKLTKK